MVEANSIIDTLVVTVYWERISKFYWLWHRLGENGLRNTKIFVSSRSLRINKTFPFQTKAAVAHVILMIILLGFKKHRRTLLRKISVTLRTVLWMLRHSDTPIHIQIFSAHMGIGCGNTSVLT